MIAIAVAVIPILFPQPNPTLQNNSEPTKIQTINCPYQGGTDLETFIQIIKAEEKAVLEKDISVIESVRKLLGLSRPP
ncbi:MAG: hypothetical protein HS114_31925 [Anaerolineales bacterium]|nr:hypothetical protein [Anaerolineales bacterium]